MHLIAWLALIFLTLTGYSGGSVLGAKGRLTAPRITDLLAILILWIGALSTRSLLGTWAAIGVWFAAGLVIGAFLTRVRVYPAFQGGPAHPDRGLWNAWKGFALKMGHYQSRMIIACLYFLVVAPFGLGMALFGDPLKIRRTGGSSHWQPKETPGKPSLDEARRQF